MGSTARYAHLSRDAEKVAAARVGGSIEDDIVRAEAAVPVGESGLSPAELA